MIITVTRSGGFAGITLTWSVRIDGAREQQQWRALIDDVRWDDERPEPAAADRFVYRIACLPREAIIPESKLTPSWQAIIDRVRAADQKADSRGGADAGTEETPNGPPPKG